MPCCFHEKTSSLATSSAPGAVLAVCGVLVLKKHFIGSPRPKGLPISGGISMDVRIPVEPYLQWDGRWQDTELGQSRQKIGAVGCTLCCTSMALQSQGFPSDPAILNKFLTENQGYTASGLLIWGAVETTTKGQFKVRLEDRPTHKSIDAQLARGNPVIAKVLFNDSIWHWVLITGKKDQSYLMNDPLGSGKSHEPMEKYGSGIHALRYLQKL